jgi:hypothetical protein
MIISEEKGRIGGGEKERVEGVEGGTYLWVRYFNICAN